MVKSLDVNARAVTLNGAVIDNFTTRPTDVFVATVESGKCNTQNTIVAEGR